MFRPHSFLLSACLGGAALLSACQPGDGGLPAVFWKDTLPIQTEIVGQPPQQEWLEYENVPLVGATAGTPSGGLALALTDEKRPIAWTQLWDKRGLVLANSQERSLFPPHKSMIASSPNGMTLAITTGLVREASEGTRIALWQSVSATGGTIRSTFQAWEPWTHLRGMVDGDAILLAAGGKDEFSQLCRVGMADQQIRWCDDVALTYQALSEDTDHRWHHTYSPVIEFVEAAPDGGFFLGGPLYGSRRYHCADREQACEETTLESWVAKYTIFGEQQWFTRFSSAPWFLTERITGIAPTDDGGVLLGGWWSPPLEGAMAQRGFVARLDSEGDVEYARSYEGELVDSIAHFAPDGAGGGVATIVSGSHETLLLMRVDDDTNILWSRPFEELPMDWSFDSKTNELAITAGTLSMQSLTDGGLILVSEPGERPELGVKLPKSLVMKLR